MSTTRSPTTRGSRPGTRAAERGHSRPSLARAGSIVHLDVRSDNICDTERGVLLIDWNAACIGDGALDLGFWLPSLHAEGGPRPEVLLPGRGDIAAFVSGYFAARAGLPAIPDAPRVRTVQLQQLRTALPWACRELGLPEPELSR